MPNKTLTKSPTANRSVSEERQARFNVAWHMWRTCGVTQVYPRMTVGALALIIGSPLGSFSRVFTWQGEEMWQNEVGVRKSLYRGDYNTVFSQLNAPGVYFKIGIVDPAIIWHIKLAWILYSWSNGFSSFILTDINHSVISAAWLRLFPDRSRFHDPRDTDWVILPPSNG